MAMVKMTEEEMMDIANRICPFGDKISLIREVGPYDLEVPSGAMKQLVALISEKVEEKFFNLQKVESGS